MLIQVGFQRERLPTSTTHVWLGMRVCLHMRTQVRLVGESFRADRALEWLLP